MLLQQLSRHSRCPVALPEPELHIPTSIILIPLAAATPDGDAATISLSLSKSLQITSSTVSTIFWKLMMKHSLQTPIMMMMTMMIMCPR